MCVMNGMKSCQPSIEIFFFHCTDGIFIRIGQESVKTSKIRHHLVKWTFFFIVKIKSMRNLEFVLRLECPNWRRHEWNKLADATSEIVLVHRALWTRTAGQQEEYSWRLIRNYETDEDFILYRVDHEFMDNYKVVLIKNQRWYSKKS